MSCSNSTAVLVLNKDKPWSPSPELSLTYVALGTVSNGAFAEIVRG